MGIQKRIHKKIPSAAAAAAVVVVTAASGISNIDTVRTQQEQPSNDLDQAPS